MDPSTGATPLLAHGHTTRVRDGDPLAAGFWPYITPSGRPTAGARPEDPANPPSAMRPDPTHYLYERYSQAGGRRLARRVYYLVRPALPRRAQLALRRAFVPRQRAAEFPRWPVEPVLVDGQLGASSPSIRATPDKRVAFVNFWPDEALLHGPDTRRRRTGGRPGDPAGARGGAAARIPVVVELRRRGLRNPGRCLRRDPRGRRRDRPSRHQARRQAVREPRQLRCQSAQDPSLPRGLGCGRLQVTGDAPQQRLDAGDQQLLRHLLSDTDPFEPQAEAAARSTRSSSATRSSFPSPWCRTTPCSRS